ADALKIATAKDRIPAVGFAGRETLRDYWQDAEHVRGIWRAASLASYQAGAPTWRTLLDLDALSKAENANWVWKGDVCLPPDERYCLVSLSNGGKDAVEVREFDTVTGKFVDGGFRLAEGKHRFDWIDRDTLLVVTDWTKADVTTSGYPFIAKLLKRGQPLAAAKQVFAGRK
ncbi:MAG: S9 family peptidase, partial [Pseudomonadota bacterium]